MFVFMFAAHGQDALFNSLSLDQSTADRSTQLVNQSAAQAHWGPVQFSAGASTGFSYDDNLNGSEVDPQSDVVTRAGISLDGFWPATDQSQLQFGTSIGYDEYLRYTGNNGLEISPDSALTYSVSLAEVVVTLFDQLSYTRQVRTEAALANVTTLPQLDNNVGLRAEWDPGHWVWLASYSHDNFWSDAAHEYLNRSSEYLVVRAGWRFAAATQMGLEASDSITDYELDTQNNNQNASLGGYLDWKARPSLTLNLRGGLVFFEPDSPSPPGSSRTIIIIGPPGPTNSPSSPGSSVNSYYASVQITHQLTDYLSHSLSLDRSLQAGLNQGSSYIEQLSIAYTLSWSLTQRISVVASASYVDGQQPLTLAAPNNPLIITAVTEDYQQYAGGLQLTWQCTDHFAASVNFGHSLRNSNQSGRNYTDNAFGGQINYAF
jgi:hypothetical protein